MWPSESMSIIRAGKLLQARWRRAAEAVAKLTEAGPAGPASVRLGSWSFGLSIESLERRFDQAWERLEVVAALEHRGRARAKRGRAARELAEAFLGDLHAGERIFDVRVEPRR